MARLIDAESPQNRMYVSDLVIEEMKKIPTVDIDRPTRSQFKRMAVQLGYEKVVRCQNCAKWQRYTKVNRDFGHCEKHDCTMKYDDFCSRPERKTDEKV